MKVPIVFLLMRRLHQDFKASLIACTVLFLAGAAYAASDPAAQTPQPSAGQAPTATQPADSTPADAGRLRKADLAAQRMAEHAKAVAERGKAAVGDWSQRTTQMIVRLAHIADEADAARGDAREEIRRAQQEVANAAHASGEALTRARELAKADVRKGKEEPEKAAVAARNAFEKAEKTTRDAAQSAKDAASKALKRSGKSA
ncbi:hypothetical protein [Hydrogenophaga sp.]|uniref:hypothetical protein n=1 Tax=Hydrogenophaga sp. TaxID=1904254 RepID=UPI003F7304AE